MEWQDRLLDGTTELGRYMYKNYPENMRGNDFYDDLYRILAVLYNEEQFYYHSYLAPDIPMRVLNKDEIILELNKIGVFKLILETKDGSETFDSLINFFDENIKEKPHFE